MKATKLMMILALGSFITACATTKTAKPEVHAKTEVAVPAQSTVYFGFDKSDIGSDARHLITGHSSFLSAHPAKHVRLEGHTDERGSREYNVGLGERRAQSVRRLMLFQGVADNQMEPSSYGEERPAAKGHNEAGWERNRRVEIVYKN
ncbi:Tol-Pal system peptidoglycan-associated lipoprotein PAL [hydrothermal vent metagenome]|uniref:Tol-Pal system peptidoglycan-associated lipoprotein PAL n=1 Tax=hydrothermal vent metagenome TaxID=652676 RepID=A0A3B0YBG3_9ZZZZ